MYAIASTIGAILAVAFGWRWLSRRHSLPCPAWLGRGVDFPGVAALFGTQQTLDRLGVPLGDRVLEVGPGPGRLLIPVARRVGPAGEAVGIDVQPDMIAQLMARAATAGIANLKGIVGDAATMIPSGQFDTIYIALALGEIPNRETVLRRCFKALKPGGVLSITEMVPDPHFVPRRTVRRLAEAAGFRYRATHGSWLSFTMNFEKRHDAGTRRRSGSAGLTASDLRRDDRRIVASQRVNRLAAASLAFLVTMVSAGTCLAAMMQSSERNPHACCTGKGQACAKLTVASENCCAVQTAVQFVPPVPVTEPARVDALIAAAEPTSFATSRLVASFDAGGQKPSALPTYLLDSVFRL